MSCTVLENYLNNLVNRIFKILPLRENEEPTIGTYMSSLQLELMGCSSLITAIHDDALFLSIISILQYLIEHSDAPKDVFKREVFNAISICNKLKVRYGVYGQFKGE